MDDETNSYTHKNRVVELQQENTELKKKISFLEAELQISKKHLRLDKKDDEWPVVDAANNEIGELQLKEKELANGKLLQEELERKLQKSFIAYNEKYYECEELKKTLEKYQCSGVSDSVQVIKCPETTAETQSRYLAEEKTNSLSKEMEAVTKHKDKPIMKLEHVQDRLKQDLGLEILEENEKYDIVLTDRDRLQQWLTKETINIRSVVPNEKDPDSPTACLPQRNSNENQKQVFVRIEDILRDAKLLQEELEQQRNCLKQLATVTQKCRVITEDSRATRRGQTHARDTEWQVKGAKAVSPERNTKMSSIGARQKEGKKYSNTETNPVSLGVPVQETIKRLQTTTIGDSQNTLRTDSEDESRRSKLMDSGFAESDIESPGREKGTDLFVGEASARDERICPVCSNYFPSTVQQEVFEQHVQSHFYSDYEE